MVTPTIAYLATHQMLDTSKVGKTDPASSGSATLMELQNIVARQQLIIQSLVMLLLEKRVIDKDELAKWIDYVDQLDGRADGKLTQDKSPVKCPSCGRVSPATAKRCQYCNGVLGDGIVDRRAEAVGNKNPPASTDGGSAEGSRTHPEICPSGE